MGGHKNKRPAPYTPRKAYHGAAGHICEQGKCEHYRSPLAIELAEAINALIESKLPPRTSVEVDSCMGGVDVKIVCGGHLKWTCERCVLEPDHEGQCLSLAKGSHKFVPDHYLGEPYPEDDYQEDE